MSKNFPVAGRIPPPRHPSLPLRVHIGPGFLPKVSFGGDDANAFLEGDEGAPGMETKECGFVPRGAGALGGHKEPLAVQESLEHLDVSPSVVELQVSCKDEGGRSGRGRRDTHSPRLSTEGLELRRQGIEQRLDIGS